jgi:Aldehyde oxidase and xanthine dehydrogenase, a/b hammerhead domain
VRDARVALGGVATLPWRAARLRRCLRTRNSTRQSCRASPICRSWARPPSGTTNSRSRSANAWSPARCIKLRPWTSEHDHRRPRIQGQHGKPIPRYDAVAKVTGKAAYAADMPLINPVYAYLVTSSIAKGRVDSFDLAAANQVRGVIDIVTHENAKNSRKQSCSAMAVMPRPRRGPMPMPLAAPRPRPDCMTARTSKAWS